MLTSLFTGIRTGELCALKGDNIDLDSGILHVRATMQRLPVLDAAEGQDKTMIHIDTPKSDCSVRDIPLNPELEKFLKLFVKPGAFLLTFNAINIIGPKGCGKTRTAKERCSTVIELKPILFDEWQDAPKIWGAIRKDSMIIRILSAHII